MLIKLGVILSGLICLSFAKIKPQHSTDVSVISPSDTDVYIEARKVWDWLPWIGNLKTEMKNLALTLPEALADDDHFPEDIFTDEQLRSGAIILHIIGVVYGFSLLAVVCNDYFIPAVECICEDLHLSKDVAAATFMASATSTPELFVNVVSTFVTESDLGIGTIVGSAMFNTLGVAAIGGLAASQPIKIKQWPVTRDSLIYIFNVIILVLIVWDDKIMWYESVVFMCLYIIYFTLMFNDRKIIRLGKFLQRKFFKGKSCPDMMNACRNSNSVSDESFEISIKPISTISLDVSTTNGSDKMEISTCTERPQKDEKLRKSLFRYPSERHGSKRFWYIYTWPIKLMLTCTVPSPKTRRFLYPLTFILCIFWIGANSYFVSWMITTIGSTFQIPHSIMGMTFLAYGGCLPEACSIYILSRRGEGDMGVSNSLGANTLAILFSLGIPWFVKGMILHGEGEGGYIKIISSGMNYIVMSLILAVLFLYLVFYIGKFKLRRKTGFVIILGYFVFVTLAVLSESGLFYKT